MGGGGGGVMFVFSMYDGVIWLGSGFFPKISLWLYERTNLPGFSSPFFKICLSNPAVWKLIFIVVINTFRRPVTCHVDLRADKQHFSPIRSLSILTKVWYNLYICRCFEMFFFLTTRVTLISHWTGRRIRMYLVYCASRQFKLCISLTWDIRHLLLSKCLFFFFFFLKV